MPAGDRDRTAGGPRRPTLPAPSIVAAADLEKACASTLMARDSSPPPRIFTRSPLWARPMSTRPATSTESPSMASSAPTLTGVYSTRKGFLNPRSLGMRCMRGSWPPSKPMGMVSRAPWPLVPRPAVLPPLPAMPRPTRRRARVDPAGGRSSWTFMVSLSRRVRRP